MPDRLIFIVRSGRSEGRNVLVSVEGGPEITLIVSDTYWSALVAEALTLAAIKPRPSGE